jgi:hypothetical protein
MIASLHDSSVGPPNANQPYSLQFQRIRRFWKQQCSCEHEMSVAHTRGDDAVTQRTMDQDLKEISIVTQLRLWSFVY